MGLLFTFSTLRNIHHWFWTGWMALHCRAVTKWILLEFGQLGVLKTLNQVLYSCANLGLEHPLMQLVSSCLLQTTSATRRPCVWEVTPTALSTVCRTGRLPPVPKPSYVLEMNRLFRMRQAFLKEGIYSQRINIEKNPPLHWSAHGKDIRCIISRSINGTGFRIYPDPVATTMPVYNMFCV